MTWLETYKGTLVNLERVDVIQVENFMAQQDDKFVQVWAIVAKFERGGQHINREVTIKEVDTPSEAADFLNWLSWLVNAKDGPNQYYFESLEAGEKYAEPF